MKKVIVIVSLLIVGISNQIVAQPRVRVFDGGTSASVHANSDIPMDQISLNFSKIDGTNSVRLPNDRGTLQFAARGDNFYNIIYIDAAGKETRLEPNRATTAEPNGGCKYPIPGASYSSSDGNILMSMCRPTDLSSGEDPNAILIGLLLPAVQKVREAAR